MNGCDKEMLAFGGTSLVEATVGKGVCTSELSARVPEEPTVLHNDVDEYAVGTPVEVRVRLG